MSDNRLEIHLFLHGSDQSGVMQQLAAIQKTLGDIQMTEQEFLAALQKVDATTTKIGTNLDAIAAAQSGEASVVQAISDEMDKFVAGGSSNGLSPAAQASLQALANKLQTSSDNSDKITAAIQAQVPVLTAIAAKGTAVVPPPPPAPPLPTPGA
jgi:hypothetical protein